MPCRPTSRRWILRGAGAAAAAAGAPGWLAAALAQGVAGSGGTLRIGLASAVTALDPHYHTYAQNNAVTSHVFDALVTNDEASVSRPGLATAWRALDDTHWELTLREGVRFHDGTPFTAADAIASLQRPRAVVNSPASFLTYTRSIKSLAAPEPLRLLIETDGPDPLLLNSLSRIRVVQARFADADTPDFNSGRAMVGTGPFRLRGYQPGSHVALARNDEWWGGRLPWSEVVLRFATDDGGRLAGLLAGEFDLIEAVPSQNLERLRADQRFSVFRGVSSRFVYLGFDHHREVSPFVTGADGQPLPRNPLRDARVRQSLNLAINRQALVERVMEGDALAASQFLPNGRPGTSDRLEVPPFDPNRARALLAEAGHPRGFRLTLHGPNDRYINDARIVQAVAQMFTRIGVDTRVEVMPFTVFSGRNARGEFSMYLAAWGVNTGETSNPLKALLATYDRAGGMGASNNGRYSNPEVDARLARALRTMDDAARNALLAEACEIAFRDVAVVPLHHEVSVWAARRGLTYATRADQYTLAMGVGQG